MSGDAPVAPTFPMRAVTAGMAAMILLIAATVWFTWHVGERIRDITRSQIVVQRAAEELIHYGDVMELSARLAAQTGRRGYIGQYRNAEAQVQTSLEELRQAIQLPANSATLRELASVDAQLTRLEAQALRLAEAQRLREASSILDDPSYATLARRYRSGANDIQQRSSGHVEKMRRELESYLWANIAAALLTFALVLLTWLLIIRPARRWGEEMRAMHAQAESATRAKGDFLAVMSHEIRTPLNGIIGFTDLLLADRTLSSRQRRQVELVQSAGSMLLTVVDDLLDFSKIEAGKIELHPEPFALETLIDNSVSIVRGAAEAKGLEMRVETAPDLPPFFVGDEDRLRQVLLNLLNNAVKFTSEGEVALSVERLGEQRGRERLRFTVSDTGPGIAPEKQRQLFRPFSQADASITRRYGGTGLGLSISKRLVELMGGEIGLDSRPGQGSSFWFTVSLAPAERLEILDQEGESPEGIAGVSILLAEDLPMNQELAVAMLSRAGHRVDVAADGQQAVEAARAKRYDLILMDIQMPRMDGITAARAIRALPGEAGRVPILAMTANVLPDQVREFLSAGMDGHVAKPVRQAELIAAVNATLAAAAPAEAGPAGQEAPLLDEAAYSEVQGMLPPGRLASHIDALEAEAAWLGAADPATQCEGIEKTAHKLVSQAGMIGLLRLSERARALEEACRGGAGVAAALDRFRAAAGDIALLRR